MRPLFSEDFSMDLSPVEDAVRDIAAGKFVIVVDDEDRENEGDLIMAAEKVTPERIAFMVRYTSGIICMPMTRERLDALRLPQMVPENTESQRTAFTISVDYRHGTTTGISAHDRAKTILALAQPGSKPEDFARPGHIFPLRYCEGGVLRRAGHTEATVDLARLAGLATPAGILCEIVNDDGTMKRLPELKAFGREHGLSIISIADLISYRRRKEKLVRRVGEGHPLKTPYGQFTAYEYLGMADGTRPLALVMGDLGQGQDVLVRVHMECLAGDVFGATSCSCNLLLQASMEKIATAGAGVIVYLRGPDGSGFGFNHRRDAEETTHDAGPAQVHDWRELGVGAQILADLGVHTLRVLTNSLGKYVGLKGYGLEVTDRVPLGPVGAEGETAKR
jgi:3,4-dihydroxy 2-butanone 4-phosphate synthase/GTP cyclohydrolase II